MGKFYALLIVPFIPMIVRHAGDWLEEAIAERKAKKRLKKQEDE